MGRLLAVRVGSLPPRWPTAATTGHLGAGVALSSLAPYSGPMTITTNGTVLDQVLINGTLSIAPGVSGFVLRRFRLVNPGPFWAIRNRGTGSLIEDGEVDGASLCTVGIETQEDPAAVVRRVNVHHTCDGVRLGHNTSLRDSFVHSLQNPNDAEGQPPHYDGVTADGYAGWEIVGNRILNPHDDTACVWVGDERFAPGSGLLQGNYLAGGGYCIYAGPGVAPGVRAIDNVFGLDYFAKGGAFGHVTKWSTPNNTWSGNRRSDGVLANADGSVAA